jgi:predicted small lipoprotein YifL
MNRSAIRTPVGILVAALLVLAGCGTSGPSPSPTIAPTAGPTEASTTGPSTGPSAPPTSVPPSPPSTAEPTAVPVETPALPDWTCDGSPIRLPGTAVRAQQTAMTVLTKDDVGEVAFTFESIGGARTLPEAEIRQSHPPFVTDASGLPVSVDGHAWATIVLSGGTGLDENFEQTYTGLDRWTALEAPLVEVVRLGDFEAISTWAVGLSGPYCMRAYPGAEGSLLVVEFRAQ